MLSALFSFQEPAAPRPRLFTEFVRSAAAGGEVEREPLAEVMAALRVALRSELRRRGLWDSPPSYLGIYGWESWGGGQKEATGSPPAAGGGQLLGRGALDELLGECYSFIFVDRLRTLKAQLSLKPNIDGLVFLNIRHFLYERQKEHDPLGFRVFEVAWAAVQACLAAGALHLLGGDPRVRNDTVLGFDPAAEPSTGPADLRWWASRADDELLPDLVTARGERQDAVAGRLARRLDELRREGIGTFRFKDLIDPLKDDVRERWAAILEADASIELDLDEGGAATRVWMERPGKRYEERESFRALVSCVLTALERLQAPERTRAYLSTLWQYLRVQSAGSATVGQAAGAVTAEPPPGSRRVRPGRPSDRTLSDLLRIPREQLPQLFTTLGRLVEACRSGGLEALPLRLDAAGRGLP
jgi:hypothetical protein